MTEDERKWDTMRDAMVLAMHEIIMSGELKEKYFRALTRQLSQSRQLDADRILRDFLKEDRDDDIPPKEF